jgi:hypothetical protein
MPPSALLPRGPIKTQALSITLPTLLKCKSALPARHIDGNLSGALFVSGRPILFRNCGVGLSPARPHHRTELIELMEGLEDIPGAVPAEGLKLRWLPSWCLVSLLGSRREDRVPTRRGQKHGGYASQRRRKHGTKRSRDFHGVR